MPTNKEGYMKEYYRQNKSKWLEIVECKCGKRLIRCNILRHHKTSNKHQTHINALSTKDFTLPST
jgi:hypothetical protein